VLYNPTMNSRVFFVPGVAATLLLVVTLVVTAMGFAREKESGTLEQIMVTPLGGTTLFLGKTLPYALIGMIDLGLVLGVGTWVFGVPLRGPLGVVFLGGSLYLMTLLGGGLLLGALARTQQQSLVAAFFLIMPAILLSGFASPSREHARLAPAVHAAEPRAPHGRGHARACSCAGRGRAISRHSSSRSRAWVSSSSRGRRPCCGAGSDEETGK
jgi:ABC-type Na+ efflux pump permease subunit